MRVTLHERFAEAHAQREIRLTAQSEEDLRFLEGYMCHSRLGQAKMVKNQDGSYSLSAWCAVGPLRPKGAQR